MKNKNVRINCFIVLKCPLQLDYISLRSIVFILFIGKQYIKTFDDSLLIVKLNYM